MENIDKAYNFYRQHIYNEEKINLLEEYNIKIAGSVAPALWELFGALLTGCRGNGFTGADLKGWEIKSAKKGGSFEYQYHLNTGSLKLEEDCYINHLFCTYSDNYEDVVVRAIKGYNLAEKYFQLWKPFYLANYDLSIDSSQRRQRFRRSIPNGYIQKHACLVMEIKNRELVHRNDSIIPSFNQA